jgi:hypothetical protein
VYVAHLREGGREGDGVEEGHVMGPYTAPPGKLRRAQNLSSLTDNPAMLRMNIQR